MIVFFVRDYRKERAPEEFFAIVMDYEADGAAGDSGQTAVGTETAAESSGLEALRANLAAALGLKPESCIVEAGLISSGNASPEATATAYMQSGRVDILIAKEETFNTYACSGYLKQLAVDTNGTIEAEQKPGSAANTAGVEKTDSAANTDGAKKTDFAANAKGDGLKENRAGGEAEADFFYAQRYDYSSGGAVTEFPFAPHDTKNGVPYGAYLSDGILAGYVAGILENSPHEANAQAALKFMTAAAAD